MMRKQYQNLATPRSTEHARGHQHKLLKSVGLRYNIISLKEF